MTDAVEDKASRELDKFLDPNSPYQPRSVEEATAVIDTYSDRLKFLWEQYIKVVQLNIVLAGATIALIANMTLLRPNAAHFIHPEWLQWSLGLAGASGLFALIWRFSAQVQMERQVYGHIKVADWYFDLNDSEKPVGVTESVKVYEKLTFWLKLLSGFLLLFSWTALGAFAFENLEALKA